MKQMLTEKILIFLLCMIPAVRQSSAERVGALLFAVSWACLSLLVREKQQKIMIAAYAALCLAGKDGLFFLPVFFYDAAGRRDGRFLLARDLPAAAAVAAASAVAAGESLFLWWYLLLLMALAFWLRRRCDERLALEERFHSYRDLTAEQSDILKEKNRELIDRQDYEIELATLNERTRIAREIHDNVGHLLTRSILQVSALQVVMGKEKTMAVPLAELKDSLEDAMDNIRTSVHDLRDDAMNLELSLRSLTDSFSFCPVRMEYEAGKLPRQVACCFLAVSREAFSNIARHSQATEASISVMEHPGFYQLMIRDNGKGCPSDRPDSLIGNGIGLLNMKERVEALGGNFNLQTRGGFSIFISVPREGKE